MPGTDAISFFGTALWATNKRRFFANSAANNKFDEIKVQIKLQAYFTLSVTFDPLRKEKPSDALRVRPDLSSPADRARPKTSSNVRLQRHSTELPPDSFRSRNFPWQLLKVHIFQCFTFTFPELLTFPFLK